MSKGDSKRWRESGSASAVEIKKKRSQRGDSGEELNAYSKERKNPKLKKRALDGDEESGGGRREEDGGASVLNTRE